MIPSEQKYENFQQHSNHNKLETQFTTTKLNQILYYFQPGIFQLRYSYDYLTSLIGLKHSQNLDMKKGFRKPSPAKFVQLPSCLNEVIVGTTELTNSIQEQSPNTVHSLDIFTN